ARTSQAQEARPNLDACLSASDQGQVLRDGAKYVAARAAFRTCSQASCPAVVQRNCARWLTEVEGAMPTAVFSARGPDGDPIAGDTSVQVDGVLLLERLTGTPTPMDPGPHSVRSEER